MKWLVGRDSDMFKIYFMIKIKYRIIFKICLIVILGNIHNFLCLIVIL